MSRVYRSLPQAISVSAIVGAATLVAVAEAVIRPGVSWRVRVIEVVVFVAVAAILISRVVQTGLRVRDDGVEIANLLRKVFIPWNRIDRFSIRSQWLLWESGRVELKDGSSVVISGVASRPWLKSGFRMIDELNGVLERAKRGQLDLPPAGSG